MSEETREGQEQTTTEAAAASELPEPTAPEEADALADEVSEQFTGAGEEAGEEAPPAEEEEAVLEEERVKDEVDIQIDLLKDPDWVVRREAVITLGEMGDERCVEPVLRALRDGDWQVREVGIEAVGNIGSPAIEGLLRLMRDWDVRKSVLMAMGKIRDERVLDPLMDQLCSDEFHDYATDALVELGEPAVPKLLAGLQNKDELARKQAIIALGRIKDPSALDALIEKLDDPDWFSRVTAAAAIEQIHDDRGRAALKPLLKDPDLVVQMRVERILAAWKKQPAQG